MTEARGYERKAYLTPQEKLKCAYFHLIRGMAQQDLADLFDVNSGRVNEAIQVIRGAIKAEE
jgi:DNA-directed RNA polymerase specialized sigma24 family protein